MNILNDFYCPDALSTEYMFSESDVYRQLPPDTDHKVYSYGLACMHSELMVSLLLYVVSYS